MIWFFLSESSFPGKSFVCFPEVSRSVPNGGKVTEMSRAVPSGGKAADVAYRSPPSPLSLAESGFPRKSFM